MTDQSSALPRSPAKAGVIALLIAAIVGVLAPLTTAREGTRHVAYQDFAKHIWTICNSHIPGLASTRARSQLTRNARPICGRI